MIDFKIDLTTLNLVIENGDFVLVKDNDEIAQSLRIRLNMALGNWFLDNRIGLDFFGIIFNKNSSEDQIRREIRRVITETVGVISILKYTQEIRRLNDKGERKLIFNFTVSTVYDKNITIQENLTINS